MLTLPIKKKWFDMIKSGEKKEEYREIKLYWDKRLLKTDIDFDLEQLKSQLKKENSYLDRTVIFRNGYSTKSPSIECMVSINIGYGKPEWGAEKDKLYYVLKILSVEEVKKC